MVAATFGAKGAKVDWVREIDPPGAGTAYLVPAEQQRSALTLAGGTVYAEFGGLSGDCGRYQGYLVGLPVTGAGPVGYFRVPTSREGAIWAVGGASVGPSGELYVATGNSANESPERAFRLRRRRHRPHTCRRPVQDRRLLRPGELEGAQSRRPRPRLGRPDRSSGREAGLRDRKDAARRREHRLPARSGLPRGPRPAALLRGGLPERRLRLRGRGIRSPRRERHGRHLHLRALPVRHGGSLCRRPPGRSELLGCVDLVLGQRTPDCRRRPRLVARHRSGRGKRALPASTGSIRSRVPLSSRGRRRPSSISPRPVPLAGGSSSQPMTAWRRLHHREGPDEPRPAADAGTMSQLTGL